MGPVALHDHRHERVRHLRLADAPTEPAPTLVDTVPDGSARQLDPVLCVAALLLEAAAHDALGDASASERALELALDLAEPQGLLSPFVSHPMQGMLERHPRHRTMHGALIAEILNLRANGASPSRDAPDLSDPLSDSELRVLRYLPTNLSRPEIAAELFVSVNTVKTHVKNLYAKLGVHGRREAVCRARSLGLLAPSRSPR